MYGVSQLYKSVIEDVINNVRELFLDEGLDEYTLQELKQSWEKKLMQTKALPPEGVPERVRSTPFNIQTQPQQLQRTAVPQQLPAGSTVQPPTSYQFPQGDGPKTVTFTLPQTLPGSQKPVTITLPAAGVVQQGSRIVLSASAAAAASALPPGIGALQPGIAIKQLVRQGNGSYVLQAPGAPATSQVQRAKIGNGGNVIQLDGFADDSSDEDDEDTEDEDVDNDGDANDGGDDAGDDEEPLNSDDDESDDGEDLSELFDSDNVIVCQYDKVTHKRSCKWKLHLKEGIMHLGGKDYVFQRAYGDAEW